MQNPAAGLCLLCALVVGCVKEISSEDRLERESQNDPVGKAMDAEELAKINCSDAQANLVKARNEQKPEAERLISYMDLYDSLRKRSLTFEEAMTRNPDLAYTEGSQDLVAAKDFCVQQTADVRLEFERYIRELVDVPTVRDVSGGKEVTVARLDFGTLRQAIEALSPEDKDLLLTRVANAEKRVEVKAPDPRKRSGAK